MAENLPCEGGCILAIVGSRDLDGDMEAEMFIEAVLDQHRPRKVVSGGAIGIDQMGVRAARARGIEVEEFVPKVWAWAVPGGFKERNEKIARACEHLVRISASTTKTYGSGHCADFAEGLGRSVWRIEIQRDEPDSVPQSHQNPEAMNLISVPKEMP